MYKYYMHKNCRNYERNQQTPKLKERYNMLV